MRRLIEPNHRQLEEAVRKFKKLDRLSKAELVSILKEIQHRLFSISVNLNNSAPVICDSWPEELKKLYKESHQAAVKSSYETRNYLGAIGAMKGKWTKDKAEGCAESLFCLHTPLSVQRKFLAHTDKKKNTPLTC